MAGKIDNMTLKKEAEALAMRLYGSNKQKSTAAAKWLMDTCNAAAGRDVLIIHSPGGWGCSDIEGLIWWERSLVDGIQETLSGIRGKPVLVQYFRSGNSYWNHFNDTPAQVKYVLTGNLHLAMVMAAQLKFITSHMENIRIVLLGVSQGAAFNNTVMKSLGGERRIYSIELGIFFAHLSRRVVTERTLALDSNGLVSDPVVHPNVGKAAKAYFFAPFRWVNYKLKGQKVKFTYCINVQGHDYSWKYAEVQGKIKDFLNNIVTT